MNPIERVVRPIDRFQQKNRALGFIYGIVKKFGDDQGGSLAALITFFGFTSMFPLLLLIVTIFGMAAGDNSKLTRDVLDSALAQFPVLGSQLGNNIHALRNKSIPGLAVGIIGLLLGSQGAGQSSQYAMQQVWNIPMAERPNFFARLKRTGALFTTLGVFFLVGSILSGFASVNSKALAIRGAATVLSFASNIALYLVAFRILTPRQISSDNLRWGAVVGGFAWTILQLLGGYLVSHQLTHASQVYGFFAVVLGILSWIYLGARIFIYSAEINVVISRRLWPRSILQPPLTRADHEVLKALGKEQDRIKGEGIDARIEP